MLREDRRFRIMNAEMKGVDEVIGREEERKREVVGVGEDVEDVIRMEDERLMMVAAVVVMEDVVEDMEMRAVR